MAGALGPMGVCWSIGVGGPSLLKLEWSEGEGGLTRLTKPLSSSVMELPFDEENTSWEGKRPYEEYEGIVLKGALLVIAIGLVVGVMACSCRYEQEAPRWHVPMSQSRHGRAKQE
jgi:hypothetical protein